MSHERVPSGESADLRSFFYLPCRVSLSSDLPFLSSVVNANRGRKKKKKEHAAKNRAEDPTYLL